MVCVCVCAFFLWHAQTIRFYEFSQHIFRASEIRCTERSTQSINFEMTIMSRLIGMSCFMTIDGANSTF